MKAVFTRQDLSSLIGGNWELAVGRWAISDTAGQWLAIDDDGLRLSYPDAADTAIWRNGAPNEPVLPFPFKLEQFKTFCAWHPTFQWEAIDSQFTNDDGAPDEVALLELEGRNRATAVLVRALLGVADAEYLSAWETHQAIERCEAEIAETKGMKPTTFTEMDFQDKRLVRLNDEMQSLLLQLNGNTEPHTEPVIDVPAKPLQRTAAQDSVILAAIGKAGYNPQALPKNEPGKRGVKAEIRVALVGVSPLFVKESTVFKRAWDRLRERGDIVDKA